VTYIMNCKICGSISHDFAVGKIINKYSIKYYQCGHCGFTQTEEPYWIEEAYAQAINDSDIGVIRRNVVNATISRAIIFAFFNSDERFVDYGGGYGMLVRLMRDYGFAFYRTDKYCQNLFAKGFDLEEPVGEPLQLLTAFEVFEHFSNPAANLNELIKLSPNILFTTVLIPTSNPKPEEWWYYGLDHGQHISFYTVKSLQYLANNNGLNLYTNSRGFHLFTRKKISPFLFRLLCRNQLATVFNFFNRRTSLIAEDFRSITGKNLT
jgi:hypothetical protein